MNTSPAKITVTEHSVIGKNPHPNSCEDGLFIDERFIAVIDGVTAKGNRRYTDLQLTPGYYAKETLLRALPHLPAQSTAMQAIDYLNNSLREVSVQEGLTIDSDRTDRLQAVIILFSAYRREIWSFGDCNCMVDQQLFDHHKQIDDLISEIRCRYDTLAIQMGLSPDDIRENDPGRACILPLLEKQLLLANANTPLGYDVLDGFAINPAHTKVIPVPANARVILASDGYPVLKPTLSETEDVLMTLLKKDPLCLHELKGTKGVTQGHQSYDDRTYVSFQIDSL